MEWERKFYDIVRETETNLANARRKLQGTGVVKNSHTPLEYSSPSRHGSTSFQPSASTSLVTNNDYINALRRRIGWSMTPPPQPAALADTSFSAWQGSEMGQLFNKIDTQNMMIDKLERLVRTLNQEKDQYRRQIHDLQMDVGSISTRLSETKLSDPHLETQVDLMRHEVRSDMQRLQNLISANKASSLYSSSLERSFKDMQQSVHSELEELRRDLSSMTHRVGRIELDVSTHGLTPENSPDRFKGGILKPACLRNLGSSRSLLSTQSFPSTSGDAFQVKEIRSTMFQLHDKLDSLERRLADSRSSPPANTSLVSGFGRKPARLYKSPIKFKLDDFEDDDLDDLDLSDDLDLDIASDDDIDLSDELEEIVNVGKTSPVKARSSSGGLGLQAPYTDKFSTVDFRLSPTSDQVNASSDGSDAISDLDLDNLDLDSVPDLDSLGEGSVDLKLDDL